MGGTLFGCENHEISPRILLDFRVPLMQDGEGSLRLPRERAGTNLTMSKDKSKTCEVKKLVCFQNLFLFVTGDRP